MKHINTFDSFNEGKIGDFFRNRKYKDESTANGILSHISDGISIEQIEQADAMSKITNKEYVCEIEEFKVEIGYYWSTWEASYQLQVDDVELECSDVIKEKIFKAIDTIYRKDEISEKARKDEDDDYIRRDARVRFSR